MGESVANNHIILDGFSGYITIPDDASLNVGTGDFSICFWSNGAIGNSASLINKTIPVGGYAIGSTEEYVKFVTTGSGAAKIANFSMPLSIGGWKHICFIRDGSVVTAYLDAVSVAIAGDCYDTSLTNTEPLLIDSESISFFDDLRLYKSVLTEPEILEIYCSGIGSKYSALSTGKKAAVVFEFDEGTGTHTHSTVLTTEANLQGDFVDGVTWQSGGTPLELGGGIAMDVFSEMWEE